MYNLIEYGDNYSDTSGGLWKFKRNEQNMNNESPANVTIDDSTSFKYKSSFLRSLTAGDSRVFKDVKIAVPLNYLISFWRPLEMSLINSEIHLELNWRRDCVMYAIADITLKIRNRKLHVPIITLSSKNSVKLVKLLEKGFKNKFSWDGVSKKKKKKKKQKQEI